MDKISVTIIAFVSVFGILAGLLVTGTVPEIFNTGSIANDTKYESKNQTQILVDFVTLYLENMNSETKTTVQELVAAKQSLENQEKILNENRNITQEILKISQEHKQVAHDHDILQKKGDNMTNEIANLTILNYKLLKQHAINTTLDEHQGE
jgi:hypothetical protein